MTGNLLIAGATSDAGKSVVVTGLCRWLRRRGVSVAPFKAQNMSLNSYVTASGAEIGRAQAVQAMAAGVEPTAVMNPVLIKPGTDTRSQLIVRGRPVGERTADQHWDGRRDLLPLVVESYRELASRHDVVIAEGAGSPAEMNLRSSDIVNLGFAREVDAPTLVVADIDRGGVFATLVGTLAVLDAADQALIRGFVINKFRGDRSLLDPGLDQLAAMTGRPTIGVLPYIHGVAMDSEDALDLDAYRDPAPPLGPDAIVIGVVRFPRLSNHTDLDALAAEPGVVVRFVTRPEEFSGCDLVILPGTRATVTDLAWLTERGMDVALKRRAAKGLPILGICGGYQMLGAVIDDPIESGLGRVPGLGLLPVRTTFGAEKVLAQTSRPLSDGGEITGYEIHHGISTPYDGESLATGEGCQVGATLGTSWHGLFENDTYRQEFLLSVAAATGRNFVPDPHLRFADVREARIERLADLVEHHLDKDFLGCLLGVTL